MAAPIKLPLNGIISVYLQSTIVIKVSYEMWDFKLYNISFLILKVNLHFNKKMAIVCVFWGIFSAL